MNQHSEAHGQQKTNLPEERDLYKKMKISEQLRFFAELKSVAGKEVEGRLTTGWRDAET